MSDTSDLIGRVFDSRYQITALVGRGGMGTVYKAVHVAMNQVVALKVLHREMSKDERQVQRFYQEARASSRLRHPNTIKVFDFGRSDDGHLYLAMEYLEGETLTQLLRREGALPVRRALNIARQVAKSLAEAHANGIVHRDLKPDNIFVTQIYGEEDFVKVLDFGVAKFFQGHPEYGALTQAGLVCGTPMYLSPEQALGRTLDGRSDLYSLGVILYEMLAGAPPFRAETPVALVMRHIHDPPPPLGEGSAGIPEPVRELVFTLLDKDRDRRPASAEVLIGMIDHAAAWVPAQARPLVAAPPRPPKASARTRVETLLPGRAPADTGEREDEATRAIPAPVPPPPPAMDREVKAPQVVVRDAPTVHLSRTAAGLGLGGPSRGAPIEEDEETVVVSLSDSGQVRQVGVGVATRQSGREPREGRRRARDSSTVIEPPSQVPVPSGGSAPARPRRAGSRVVVVALVVALGGATGVGVAALIQGGGEERGFAAGETPAAVPQDVSSDATPRNSGQDQATARGAGADSPPPQPPVPPPQPPPREATLTLETTPAGAAVFLGERRLGLTPLALTVREGDPPFALRFAAEGFDEAHLTLDPSEVVRSGQTVRRLTLERKATAAPDPRTTTPKPPARPPSPRKKSGPVLKWE